MALDWETVKAEHVQAACEQIALTRSDREWHGLVVFFEGRALPAKEVSKVAYRLANGLAPDAEVKFSSGDTMLGRLKRLGFRSERKSAPESDVGVPTE